MQCHHMFSTTKLAKNHSEHSYLKVYGLGNHISRILDNMAVLKWGVIDLHIDTKHLAICDENVEMRGMGNCLDVGCK